MKNLEVYALDEKEPDFELNDFGVREWRVFLFDWRERLLDYQTLSKTIDILDEDGYSSGQQRVWEPDSVIAENERVLWLDNDGFEVPGDTHYVSVSSIEAINQEAG